MPGAEIGSDFAMSSTYSPIAGNVSINQLDHQVLNELIMPDLEDMAANEQLLERVRERRFNRDEPPPYRSPSPDQDGEDGDYGDSLNGDGVFLHPLQALSEANRRQFEEMISEPLNETELRDTQFHFEMWHPAYNPGRLYLQAAEEAKFRARLDPQGNSYARRQKFCCRAGRQELDVFVRHGIKKRWQRLGVWNPDWGIPGQINETERDNPSRWHWKWQGDVPDCGADPPSQYNPQHPNSRAVRLRQGLRRGESGILPPPRHKLEPDASPSVAESFITSRPWYIYHLEQEEERTRLARLSGRPRRLFDEDHKRYVGRRWEESGEFHYRDKLNRSRLGWKWSHETPSPEPQDLTVTTPDYTPSEVDALEAIPPRTPPPAPPPVPKGRWVHVPGQIIGDWISDDESEGPASPVEVACESDGISERGIKTKSSSPPRTPSLSTGQTRGRKPRSTVIIDAPEPDEPPKPRRSARIAAQKQQRAVVAAPVKPRTLRAKPTAGSGGIDQKTRTRRGPGRPPKIAASSETSKPKGVVKKRRGRPPKKP